MIQEVAILNVVEDRVDEFQSAFEQAQVLVKKMPGYVSHQLSRCVENDGRFLLSIYWKTLEDHTQGFRESQEYVQWKKMLHHFYDPFPVVEHYEVILSNDTI